MRVLVTVFLVALAAEMIQAADVCVATTETESCETGETATTTTCTACSTHLTETPCEDASCTWGVCQDDCPAKTTENLCTAADCSWEGCEDVCVANNEAACTAAAADCTWDTPGTCTDPCAVHDQTACGTTSGCSWGTTCISDPCADHDQAACGIADGCSWGTACTSDTPLDCPSHDNDETGCAAGTTACSWTPGTPSCKPKGGDCGTAEASCNTVGCEWKGCENTGTCPGLAETACGTADGCTWAGSCGNTAGTAACNTYMNVTMCCAHECKWMKCSGNADVTTDSGNGFGYVMPSLLVLLLVPVNLLI